MFNKGPKKTVLQPASIVQIEVAQRLLERLDGLKLEPASVLDVGCGSADQTRALAQRFPKARVIGLDASCQRLELAKKNQGRWRKSFELLAADANRLPLAQGTVDLLFSSLMLPHCSDLPALLNGFRRVLKPGGFMLFSTFGPDTLSALRDGLAENDQARYPFILADVQTVGNALMRAGFAEPVLDTDWIDTRHHKSVDLLRELRALDANVWLGGARALLRGYRAQERAENLFSANWEVVYASAWAPEDGAPIRDFDGAEVASFSVENIGRRRR